MVETNQQTSLSFQSHEPDLTDPLLMFFYSVDVFNVVLLDLFFHLSLICFHKFVYLSATDCKYKLFHMHVNFDTCLEQKKSVW